MLVILQIFCIYTWYKWNSHHQLWLFPLNIWYILFNWSMDSVDIHMDLILLSNTVKPVNCLVSVCWVPSWLLHRGSHFSQKLTLVHTIRWWELTIMYTFWAHRRSIPTPPALTVAKSTLQVDSPLNFPKFLVLWTLVSPPCNVSYPIPDSFNEIPMLSKKQNQSHSWLIVRTQSRIIYSHF